MIMADFGNPAGLIALYLTVFVGPMVLGLTITTTSEISLRRTGRSWLMVLAGIATIVAGYTLA